MMIGLIDWLSTLSPGFHSHSRAVVLRDPASSSSGHAVTFAQSLATRSPVLLFVIARLKSPITQSSGTGNAWGMWSRK